jgi:hypothetical protein
LSSVSHSPRAFILEPVLVNSPRAVILERSEESSTGLLFTLLKAGQQNPEVILSLPKNLRAEYGYRAVRHTARRRRRPERSRGTSNVHTSNYEVHAVRHTARTGRCHFDWNDSGTEKSLLYR